MLRALSDAQNARWLKWAYPALYREMQELAWISDGISPLEETAVEELLYLNADSPGNIGAALALPWLADGVSEAEVEALAEAE